MNSITYYLKLKILFEKIGKDNFINFIETYDASYEINKYIISYKNLFPDYKLQYSKEDFFIKIHKYIINKETLDVDYRGRPQIFCEYAKFITYVENKIILP